jgi:hypothetical protein
VTTLSATTPPSIIQDSDEQRQDLAADMNALTPADGTHPDATAVLHRPAILRRIAAALAPRIPAGTDRLIARSGKDSILAAAVSLHSGISFALIDLPAGVVIGELHRSERTVLLGYEQKNEDALLDILTVAGALPTLALSVLGAKVDSGESSLTRQALFLFAELSTHTKENHHV